MLEVKRRGEPYCAAREVLPCRAERARTLLPPEREWPRHFQVGHRNSGTASTLDNGRRPYSARAPAAERRSTLRPFLRVPTNTDIRDRIHRPSASAIPADGSACILSARLRIDSILFQCHRIARL